jgi:hypothetical protein
VKPFTAAVVTLSERDEPPLGREMELGVAVMVKSAATAGVIAREAVAVCESESAAPVTVIVAPEVAPAAVEAVSVNCPSCPGATETVEGVAVTPAGSPLSETVTGSVKPFTAVVVTVKDRAEPPLCSETELGAAVMVKSGAGAAVIETAAVAVWEVELAEPVTVTVADDTGAAELAAVSMNWPSCPGESETVEGLAVTPVGRPLSETLTGLLNPFIAPAVTVSAWAVPPLCRATVAGAAAIVKSGNRAGPEDVPQPSTNVSAASNARRAILIITGPIRKCVKPGSGEPSPPYGEEV